MKENIFKQIETVEKPSVNRKKQIMAEVETVQNISKIMDHFIGNYIKSAIKIISK
jgi:hypothetical protein